MFVYDKKLQYPVKIDKPNPRLASVIISQYGGPDGELGASLRYLSQRYSMPFDEPIGSNGNDLTNLCRSGMICLFFDTIAGGMNHCADYRFSYTYLSGPHRPKSG